MNGKGDGYRPVDREIYDFQYNRIHRNVKGHCKKCDGVGYVVVSKHTTATCDLCKGSGFARDCEKWNITINVKIAKENVMLDCGSVVVSTNFVLVVITILLGTAITLLVVRDVVNDLRGKGKK